VVEVDQATHADLIASTEFASPLPVHERIPALDVLRGVAVAGILLANVQVFFGLTFIPPERAAALPTAAADHVAEFLEHVFIDGKFYSIFSLLFGIGFGVQLSRGGRAALPRFKRRLRILLGIGAIHAFVIWAGDHPEILRSYRHGRNQGCLHRQPGFPRRPMGRSVFYRPIPESSGHVRAGSLDRAHGTRALTIGPSRHTRAVEHAWLGCRLASELRCGVGA
jgi:hypothetical protein